jgi:hypothetical protein
MPAAAIYSRDPDNHLIEYLTMLDYNPRADLGIIPWSEWACKELSESWLSLTIVDLACTRTPSAC